MVIQLSYDREYFESEFLCVECGALMYVGFSEPEIQFCLNENCSLRPTETFSILDPSAEATPSLHAEVRSLEENLIERIGQWDHDALINEVVDMRRSLAKSLIMEGVMVGTNLWFICGEILLLVNRNHPAGTVRGRVQFTRLFKDIERSRMYLTFIEDLATKRRCSVLWEGNLRVLTVKYLAIGGFRESLGELSSYPGVDSEDSLFPYAEIEHSVAPDVELNEIDDLSEVLDSLWPLSLQLRYLFKGHFRTAQQYEYHPNVLDMSVLVGWYIQMSAHDDNAVISSSRLANETSEMQMHFDRNSDHQYSAQNFVDKYISSRETVPIVVNTSEGWVLDKYTLLLYLIYLQGSSEIETPPDVRAGTPLLQDMRKKTGEKFEEWLRIELFANGYAGPASATTVRINNEGFEYDILALSEEKRRIILAEAKYRDLAPSSLTGENLLRQELLGSDALRDQAERQQLRLEFFRKHTHLFEQHLNPQHPWDEYEIGNYLVTKHVPLAHRYKSTEMIRATEFLDSHI